MRSGTCVRTCRPQCTSGGQLAARRTEDLPTQAVNGENCTIALDVVLANVVEEPTTLTDHHEQTTASVVVVLVGLEVVVEIRDPRSENGNLHFGRSSIGIARAVRGDNCCFVEHEKGKFFR